MLSLFKVFMSQDVIKPVNEAIEQQQEIAGELAGSVQSVRKMINYMRNSVSDGLHDSFNKLRNISRRFITLMKKLFSIFNGIFQTLENNVLALTAVGETAASTINIFKPTLKLIGVFCFDENKFSMVDSIYFRFKFKTVKDSLEFLNTKEYKVKSY